MMNVHHLELFYYAAKFGGITPAVRQMPYGIQQPAMSGQLIQLEEALGCRLFHRRPFSLTPGGRELYEFLVPFFGRLGEVEDSLKGAAATRLRIAASTTVLRDFLPDLLAQIQGEVREPLRLALHEANQMLAEQQLARQEIDCAVVEMGGAPAHGLRVRQLIALPVCLVVPTAHPLKKFETILEDGHGGWPLVAFPMHETLTRQFTEFLASKGISWWPAIEAASIDLVHAYTLRGFGVGLSLNVPGMKILEGLRVIPVREAPALKIAALWQGNPFPLLARFLEIAAQRAAKIPTN